MMRTKVAGVAVAVAALAGGAMVAPAQAQTLRLPCDTFAPPYDYPCEAAESTANFAIGQVNGAYDFVIAVRDEAGEVVFRAYCTVFPNQPQCQ